MLKESGATAFQCSTRGRVPARRRARALAVACARPVDTTGMKALQLHQVTRTITAIRKPDSVRARCCRSKSSPRRGGLAAVDAVDAVDAVAAGVAVAAGATVAAGVAIAAAVGPAARP